MRNHQADQAVRLIGAKRDELDEMTAVLKFPMLLMPKFAG
jgi:hypothetical protein